MRLALGVAWRLSLLAAVLARWAGAQLGGTPLPLSAPPGDPLPRITADALGPAAVTAQEVADGLCSSGAPQLAVVELGVAGAHAAMLSGLLSCSGLVAAYLQRIQAFDQPLQLNAIRAINPWAHQRSAELDAELLRFRANGTQLPSLFCVPLLVKDNIDVRRLATTAGNAGLADNLPLSDARVIDLLQRRGALVLAKTAMGEFAFFPTSCISSMSGTVRNPYSLAHTPAGSSGGSASGCAASFGMAALGTDTGNSVRGPASHTALVGLRASLGLISQGGVVPLRRDRDTVGPLARTVEDAVRVFEAMVGPDPADPLTQLLQNLTLPDNYTKFLVPAGLAGARIGVFRQIRQGGHMPPQRATQPRQAADASPSSCLLVASLRSNLPGTDPEIQALFEAALEAMRLAGATLVEDFQMHGNRLGLDWDADMGGQGPAVGHWNVQGRWEDLWACQSPFRVGLDDYLATGNASTHYRNLQALYRAGTYHPAVGEELLVALRAPYSPEQYPTPAMRARLVESMDGARVDAVVFPTWGLPPLRVGDGADEAYDGNNSPMIAPHTGSPAITVPMGYSGRHTWHRLSHRRTAAAGDGLPAGIQFLGRPFDEPALIRVAYAFEQATQHRRQPPLFPECQSAPADAAASPHNGSSTAG